jgi:hypothetical protein
MTIQHTIPRWRTDLISTPRRATHAWTTEASNRRINRVQLQDFQGRDLATRAAVSWWLTTLANGTPSTRVMSASGFVRAVTNGEILQNGTLAISRNAGIAYSNTGGDLDIGIRTSTAQVWRVALIFSDGSRSVSSQACWV